MKKILLVFLVLAMIICAGCTGGTPASTVPETVASETAEAPETTAPPETTEETVPVPELTTGIAKVDGVPAVLMLMSRGDTLDVVADYDEKHFVVKTESGYGLVEKALVRPETAEAFETRTGYARYNSEFYDNLRLSGEPACQLSANTELKLLEELDWCYVAELDGTVGYIAKDSVSNKPIKGGNSSGADGGDISLMVPGAVPLFSMTPQTGDVTGTATVLADRTPVVLGYFDRGDTIPIVAEEGFAEEWEGYVTVYLEDIYTWVPEDLLRQEADADYEVWTGYSRYKASMYEDMWLLNVVAEKMKTNTEVQVLEELENAYLVEVDGVLGFMDKEMVSEKKLSGNSSGGEWTPPAM